MKLTEKTNSHSLLEKYDYSGPRSQIKNKKMHNASSEPISMAKAVEIFDDISKTFNNLFNYVYAGCQVRAHLMSGYLFEKGINPSKAWWIHNLDGGERKPVNLRKIGLEWGYHVTSAINVLSHKDDKPIVVVIDPSIFDGPVTVSAWAGALGITKEDVQIKGYDESLTGNKGDGGFYSPTVPLEYLNSIKLDKDFSHYNNFTNVKTFPNRYKSKLREDFEKQQHDLCQVHHTKNAKAIRRKFSI